jgi:hypothetical protein
MIVIAMITDIAMMENITVPSVEPDEAEGISHRHMGIKYTWTK